MQNRPKRKWKDVLYLLLCLLNNEFVTTTNTVKNVRDSITQVKSACPTELRRCTHPTYNLRHSTVSSGSQDHSNIIAKRCKIWVRSSAGARNFYLLCSVQTGPGAHPTSYKMGTGDCFLGSKAAGT
jgi:hypothetical protein